MSEEIKLALTKGYKIIKIDQVWHWPENQRINTLFKDYIARAYREKVEASGKQLFLKCSHVYCSMFTGWPPNIETLITENGMDHPDTCAAVDAYVHEQAAMGIMIRPEFVEKNIGRRTFAKLVLNK